MAAATGRDSNRRERFKLNSTKVTPADIPDHVKDSLARALLDAARRFYSDPENVRRFEEWKARKAAESTA